MILNSTLKKLLEKYKDETNITPMRISENAGKVFILEKLLKAPDSASLVMDDEAPSGDSEEGYCFLSSEYYINDDEEVGRDYCGKTFKRIGELK